jgi:hypothetical protein
MIFSRLNLRSALIRERGFQQRLVNEANELLRNASAQDEEIFTRLREGNDKTTRFTYEERSNVFSLEEIKSICIRYRLRFLDSSQFKAGYPYEAISAIKSFEKNNGIKIQSFKILAPSKAFDLENINKDPLLFAQLNNVDDFSFDRLFAFCI